jgi:hypothetical protein
MVEFVHRDAPARRDATGRMTPAARQMGVAMIDARIDVTPSA